MIFEDNVFCVDIELDNTRSLEIKEVKKSCGFCGDDGFITVAGNHDISCKKCNENKKEK